MYKFAQNILKKIKGARDIQSRDDKKLFWKMRGVNKN